MLSTSMRKVVTLFLIAFACNNAVRIEVTHQQARTPCCANSCKIRFIWKQIVERMHAQCKIQDRTVKFCVIDDSLHFDHSDASRRENDRKRKTGSRKNLGRRKSHWLQN